MPGRSDGSRMVRGALRPIRAAPGPVRLRRRRRRGSARIRTRVRRASCWRPPPPAVRCGWRSTASCAPATRRCAQPRMAEQAARGCRNLTVRFAAEPGAPGLGAPAPAVRPAARTSTLTRVCTTVAAAGRRCRRPSRCGCAAIFCDGGTFIADATASTSGTSAADVDRLIWRTVGACSPTTTRRATASARSSASERESTRVP